MKSMIVTSAALLLMSTSFAPAGRATVTRGGGYAAPVGYQQPDFATRVLAVHNAARAEVGVGPVRWNPQLAADADAWARHLAASREFEHADDGDNPQEGENLFMGTRGHFPVERMVGYWREERKAFEPGSVVDDGPDFENYGHWTQMVWRNTHEVGCAVERNDSDDYLVCRYAEPGNVVGERPY